MAFVTAVPAGALVRAPHARSVVTPRRAPLPAARPRAARARVVATAPREVSAEELEEVLKGKPGPLLTVFSAKWCGPCKLLVPELEELGDKMADRMDILKVDSDDYADYASAIGVRGLPSLYFIKDGELKHKREGALTAGDLQSLSEHFFYDGPDPELPVY